MRLLLTIQQGNDNLTFSSSDLAPTVLDLLLCTPFPSSGTNSMALGLWTVVLSNYLKLLTGSLSMVGYSETIQGVTKVLFSFIAGCFADNQAKETGKHKRAVVLKISGLLSLLAMGVTIAALYIDRDHKYPDSHWTPSYWIMVIGLCLWGTFAGVYYPAMTAILADSVETGNRTRLYTYRWMLQMFTRALGPLLAAVLFMWVNPIPIEALKLKLCWYLVCALLHAEKLLLFFVFPLIICSAFEVSQYLCNLQLYVVLTLSSTFLGPFTFCPRKYTRTHMHIHIYFRTTAMCLAINGNLKTFGMFSWRE